MKNKLFILFPSGHKVVRDSMENFAINLGLQAPLSQWKYKKSLNTYIMYSTSHPNILPKAVGYRILESVFVHVWSWSR